MPEIRLDTDKLRDFSKKLRENRDFREKFAEDPRGMIKAEGVGEIPEDMIPKTLDLKAVERKIKDTGKVAGVVVVEW